MFPQSGKAAEKTPTKPCDVEVYEKKIKLLEKQRKDVSLVFFVLHTVHPLFAIGESLCVFCFLYVECHSFHFLMLLTGTGGEQAVGHSVELHEVTV